MKKYAPKRKDKLIYIDEINEEMKLVDGSDTDYITPSAKVYKDYGNGYFYPKKVRQNERNKYLYVSITFADGVNKQRRLHVLLAKAFIPNPDPLRLKYVGHKDNIKWHCTIDNLYWTNNKCNVVKAIEDGLLTNDKAENDDQSKYIKVLDKDTKKVAGVYGSIRQCGRCIENISEGDIAKVCRKQNYKPRSRKYIYQLSNKEEFDEYKELQNKHLVEAERVNKKPKIFRMTNKSIGYNEVMDNQTRASKICGIPQAQISHLIKNSDSKDGWSFEYIGETDYIDSSGYKYVIDMKDNVAIKNINTGDILEFECKQFMLDHFGLTGHNTSAYFDKGHLIMHEWKVV